MVQVIAGKVELDKAARVTKLAAQVNESFYAEVKVAKIRAEAGEKIAALGTMKIGN